MRCHDLPLADGFHPDVGQAVVVLVGLAVGFSLLVVGAGDDRGVAVETDLEI